MSSEIEEHVTKKYEIKKRLGKGVSRNITRGQGGHIYLPHDANILPNVRETSLDSSVTLTGNILILCGTDQISPECH